MIKVFYSGCGFISQVNEQGFNRDLAEATLGKYNGYFLMNADVMDVLEHFDVATISRLDFIYDKLPRGITLDLAHRSRFGLANDVANARFSRFCYEFELRKGVKKYGYDNNKTFKNALHILDDEPVPQPATKSNNEKINPRHATILAVIKMKGYDPQAIPLGEKGTIEAICRADYPELFESESSFTTAWKSRNGLFNMANY